MKIQKITNERGCGILHDLAFNEGGLRHTSTLLYNIFMLQNIIDTRVTIAEFGGIEVVLISMELHKKAALIQEYGLRALSSIANTSGTFLHVKKIVSHSFFL